MEWREGPNYFSKGITPINLGSMDAPGPESVGRSRGGGPAPPGRCSLASSAAPWGVGEVFVVEKLGCQSHTPVSQRRMHCRAGCPKKPVLPLGVPTKGGPAEGPRARRPPRQNGLFFGAAPAPVHLFFMSFCKKRTFFSYSSPARQFPPGGRLDRPGTDLYSIQ